MGAASKPGALLDADAVRAALAGPGRGDSGLGAGGLWTSLEVVAVTGSTNADLLRRGGAEGQVLVAESQVAGRGRMGRSWVSAPGASLTFSVLLRPGSVPAARRGWLPLLTGVAVASAVRDVSGLAAVLKWPNDVLVGSRKLAGILAEQSGDAVVVGIGLNVATPADGLPVSPSGLPATSLLVEGASVSREALLAGILRELERRYTTFRDDPDPARVGLLSDYRALCATLGRSVRVELPGGRVLSGVAEDIDVDGRLLVAPASGAPPVAVSAGDVIHVRLLRHLHRDFVVRDTLVPAAEGCPGGVLNYRALVVVPREPANRVQVGEPGNGGEGDLPAFVPAQQLGAAEPVHRRQVLANLCLVVTLIVVSPSRWRPPAPNPRDHALLLISVVFRFVPVFCRQDDRKQEQIADWTLERKRPVLTVWITEAFSTGRRVDKQRAASLAHGVVMTPQCESPMALDDLLAWQDGVLDTRSALDYLSPAALRWQLTSGRWQQPCRGIVVAHSGPLTPQQTLRIAALWAGKGAALAGLTAARLQGFRGFDEKASSIHLLIPARARHAVRSIQPSLPLVVHYSRNLAPADIHPARQPPQTRIARSLVDAAAWMGTDRGAQAVLAAGVQQRLVRVTDLVAELDRNERLHRRKIISQTLGDIAGGAHALSELDFTSLVVRQFKLPAPDRQVPLRDAHGRRRWLDAV